MKKGIILLRLFCLYAIILALTSGCEKPIDDSRNDNNPAGNEGFYFINEGNYTWGNGSLMLFSYDSLKVYDNIFESLSGKALGDIPCKVVENGDKLYIIVNNSGKIEIIDSKTSSYVGMIDRLVSPRDIAFLDDSTALVTSIYSDSVTVVNTERNDISGYINIQKTSEAILLTDNKVFITNWSGGNSITVMQRTDLSIIETITVPKEPSSMVIDKAGLLRVICSGGYLNEDYPAIVSIDTETLDVVSTLTFPTRMCNPGELVISSSKETLYYLNDDIYQISFDDTELPVVPLIKSMGRNLYRLGYDQDKEFLVVTDAVDYVQKGYIYIYRSNGEEFGKYNAGIIPGKMSF